MTFIHNKQVDNRSLGSGSGARRPDPTKKVRIRNTDDLDFCNLFYKPSLRPGAGRAED
jgi:hypothetical protein